MATNSATVVAASLDSSQLEASINSLVNMVAEKTKAMANNFTSEVKRMENAVKNLGNIKIDSGGAVDGGSSRRAKLFSQEGEIIQRNNQIVKEYNATLDQQAAAIRKANQVSVRTGDAGSIRNADTLQTMNIQLDLLRERLREARQQYSSFVAMASSATKTGDKGLYQFATEGVHKYGNEVRTLIPQIRGLQNAIQQMGDVIAPQGHTIQNYVNSLQKANPELAQLNEQFRRGQSELQNQSTSYSTATQSAQRYTEEIRKQAQAIRASKEWQEKGYYRIGEASFYNPETSRLAKKDIISLEEQILRWKQKQTEETDKTTRSEYQYSEAIRSAADALRAQLHGTKAASIEVGGRTIYNEKEAGSIESQLTALMKDRTKEFNLQHEVALAIEQDEKRISEELLKQRQTSDGAKKTKEAETYRQMIAKTLGIQESQVKLANAETASYEQLDATLKQLIRTKNRLGSEGLNSAFGKGLLEDIKEVEAAMQRIKKFGYNKVSLSNALGLSEKSLDDIARKSQQLQYVMRNVDTTTEEGALAFQRASLNARLLKERENELLGKNNQLINSNNSLIKSNTAVGRSWNYMKNRLAFYFTVGASTQFVKNLIEVRSQYELNERALGILVNSAERGTHIFNELSQMALVSPYTLIELSSAAKQLTAYDIAAKDVVDTTRRLADMASAVGVPMERLTYALGQIKAYGYLNSRDNRMFANAGIPLVKQLADYYTELEGRIVSTADVYDRIKKKAVGYNEVMDVINRMTDEGGRFFNFQEKMAGTLKVQLANLTLAWNNMLNEIGASQQGVLATGIGAMKNLFLAWKDLSNVLTTVALTFGLVRAQMLFANIAIGKSNMELLRYIANNKAATWADYTRALQTKKLTAAQASWLIMSNQTNNALAASVIRMKVLDAATVRSIRNLNGLSLAFAKLRLGGIMALAGISKAFRSLGGILAANAPLLFITGIIDAFTHLNNVADANKDFNKNIANGAKEASKALSDFLKEEDKVQARAKAQSNNLSQSEASKTWDALREQIELSSLSAKQLIPDLLKIPDINERITAAFDLAERIQDATNKLSDLEDELSVNQDSWLWGLFGEGLAEDIEDYTKRRKELHEQAEFFAKNELNWWEELKIAARGVWDGIGQGAGKEAFDEITEFANKAAGVIKQRLGEDGVKDAEKVGEAIARVMAEVEKNPKISGAGKSLFESRFVEIMGSQFEGVFDIQKYYYTVFLEQLKRDYSNTFRGVTDDIIDNAEHKWNPAQIKAVEETAAKIKKDMPQASRDAIDEIISQLNEKSFKLHFVATFSMERSELQKQFDKSFGDPTTGGVNGDYRQLRPKENEDFLDYRKNLNKTLEEGEKRYAELKLEADANRKSNKALAESLDEEAKKQNNVNKAAQVVKNTWHLLNEEKERNKAQKQAESELAKALKDELKLIETVRSSYKELTKEGASHTDAVKKSVSGYEKSAANINAVLNKYGIGLDLSKFAGISNPHELQKMLRKQLNALVGKAKPTEIQALEVELKKVDLDVDKYDLTMITKGLNNELDKLKDEYELAVELDANPELGDMFADMFGINTSTLPQTFGEALDRAQEIINRKLSDLNIASPFELMQSDVNEFANSSGLEKESEAIKELAKWQNTFRDMFKKNLLDSEKMLDDYVKKYGGYSDKIAEIEADRLEKIKKLNDAYYTEEMRKRPEYIAKMNAINQGASREKSNVEFDAFKNSRYYTMMFENLDYISTKTIRDMRDRLRELMDSMKDLEPEQLKQIMTQYEKLEQKLVKRSPFKTLTKDLKNYLKTSGDRKAANEAFRNAQKEYDAQEKNVAALKEKYEQAKANNNTSQSYLDFLKIEIDGENEVLQILKEQLKVAEEKADKYNLIKKLALEELSQTATMVAANLKGLAELRDQMNELFGVDASKGETLLGHQIDGLIDGLSKASDGISKITSSAQSGNVFGIASGAVDIITGIGDGIASLFGDGSARTKRLNREINESRETVRQLSMAYDDLERAINKSLGTGETEARRLAIANKEAQLAELERQKELEQSKRSKDRDDDAIKQYEESIHSIKNEIADLKEEVVNNLWGEDVKSAAEAFVDTWVSAWKAGKTTLKDIKDEMNDIMLNIVKKGVSSQIVEGYLSPIYKELESMTKEGSLGGMALTNEELKAIADMSKTAAVNINDALKELYGQLNLLGVVKPDNNLSALQQGITGITEDTAGALEAITSGMSQQVYYQSTLLEQIRDSVVAMDFDINLGVMSQILLQLQTSYQTQQTIQSILEGWSSPSGLAVRVEMQ